MVEFEQSIDIYYYLPLLELKDFSCQRMTFELRIKKQRESLYVWVSLKQFLELGYTNPFALLVEALVTAYKRALAIW